MMTLDQLINYYGEESTDENFSEFKKSIAHDTWECLKELKNRREKKHKEISPFNLEFISYSGKWPRYCNGEVKFRMNKKLYKISNPRLSEPYSYDEDDDPGEWEFSIDDIKNDKGQDIVLTKTMFDAIHQMVNKNLECGHCGGCS
jgi:nuclear transport factor 2 (NTF2) superfamily protein